MGAAEPAEDTVAEVADAGAGETEPVAETEEPAISEEAPIAVLADDAAAESVEDKTAEAEIDLGDSISFEDLGAAEPAEDAEAPTQAVEPAAEAEPEAGLEREADIVEVAETDLVEKVTDGATPETPVIAEADVVDAAGDADARPAPHAPAAPDLLEDEAEAETAEDAVGEIEMAEPKAAEQDDELDLSAVLGETEPDAVQAAPDRLVLGEAQRVDTAEAETDLDLSDILGAGAPATGEGSEDEAGPAVETATAEPEEEPRKAPRVRVMKMSRADFDAQFVDADEAEVVDEAHPEAPETDPQAIRDALGHTGLSEEDEADLVNELLAVEQDAQRDRADAAPGDSPDAAPDAVAELEPEAPVAAAGEPAVEVEPAPAAPSETPDEDSGIVDDRTKAAADLAAMVSEVSGEAPAGRDVSVDRLLAQANSELEKKEGSRRRSAIAHLKAAVAAVRADGGKVEKESDAAEARTLDRFRSDLASVVRPDTGEAASAPEPVRPRPASVVAEESDADAAEKPARSRRRMPPLMLVSEQRIDKPAVDEAPATPVRPRRVHSTDVDGEETNELFEDSLAGGTDEAAGNLFEEDDAFSRFVADHGAEGLQEILEASAAFGAEVQGIEKSSRPQIMHRMVRFLPEDSFSREEGLRAFGILLREGRIKRVERGLFTIAPASRFVAEKKTATG